MKYPISEGRVYAKENINLTNNFYDSLPAIRNQT